MSIEARLHRSPTASRASTASSRSSSAAAEARGEHTPESDVDLGLYYELPLDVEGLKRVAATSRALGRRGGWLTVDGTAVDSLYRDLHRVRRSWADASCPLRARRPGRGDSAYVAGSLFRVVGVLAHALHGAARRWLINEKGAVASAGRLACAPPDFAARAPVVRARGNNVRGAVVKLEAASRFVGDVQLAVRAV